MNWLDIVIVVAGSSITLIGWAIGGIFIGVTALGILAGMALATRLQDEVQPLFSRFIDSDNGAEIASFALIFVLIILASVAFSAALKTVLSKLMLGWVDKAAGLVVGLVLTFVIGSVVLATIQHHPVLGLETTIEDSALGSFLADKFDVVLREIRFIPKDLGTLGQTEP